MSMSSPPNSIAQLLAYPAAGQAPAPPANDESSTDPALLISYLREHYNDGEDHRDDPRFEYKLDGFPPAGGHAGPASPPNPSVAIPPALAAIPTPANAPYLINLPGKTNPETHALSTDRGEMGGKRRKQPHERAGYEEWKSIDGSSRSKRRREDEYGFDGEGDGHVQGGGGVGDQRIFPPGTGEITEPTGGEQPEDKAKRTKISKELRAEQNRTAQQKFRRKREERIKQLERDSAELAAYKERMGRVESELLSLALELEAKTIEASGLRRVVSAVGTAGISTTRADGSLVLSAVEWDARDETKGTAAAAEAACDGLARASREVAKLNRQRREAAMSQV